MDFEITGHSGCQLTVCRENGSLTLLKRTDKASYAQRLFRQSQKQRAFHRRQGSEILTPDVLDVIHTADACTVKMQFVYGQNFIEFFEYAGQERLICFVDILLKFIEEEIELSPLERVDWTVVKGKYDNVRNRGLSNPAVAANPDIQSNFDVLDSIFDCDRCVVVPVGVCHGDLTLSNMLFNGSRVYFLDFLDSFIETPLMDIVKLRQDTFYGWSFLMFKRSCDRVRHKIILDYIDQHIVGRFQHMAFYRDNYVLFQLMNFLRILQYAHEPEVIVFLNDVIDQLIQEYEKHADHPARGGQAGI